MPSPSQQLTILAFLTTLSLLMAVPCRETPNVSAYPLEFTSGFAWSHLEKYTKFSPIIPDSPGNLQLRTYVTRHLVNNSWEVELQSWRHQGSNRTLHNLIAKKSTSNGPTQGIVILGAHYDTRIIADRDPDHSKRHLPVPGANDGGSGVVVLLELARVLDLPQDLEIWLVFFDAEDQGGIPGWDGGIAGWCIGSTYFVEQLSVLDREKIRVAIIIDLVGDFNLKLVKEGASDPTYVQEIWNVAADLGYSDCFVNQLGGSIIDDHQPFLQAGIPAVDIIQQMSREGYIFFRWHHTTNDTIDNVSPDSLEKVGRTLEYYMEHFFSDKSLVTSSPDVLVPDFPVGSALPVAISILIICLIRGKLKTHHVKVEF